MLRGLTSLVGYRVSARDGSIGCVDDFLFSPETWRLLYLVVATGFIVPLKRFLIPPEEVREPDWDGQTFPVDLTRSLVKSSPPLKSGEPEPERYFRDVESHYSESSCGDDPGEKASGDAPAPTSLRRVLGFRVGATDGEIGNVHDVIVDEGSHDSDDSVDRWAIRYLVILTRGWWPEARLLVAPGWLGEVRWLDRRITLPFPVERVRDAPLYGPRSPVDRDYEARLHDHYGRTGYWV